jgi:hypothetical protein
MGKKQAWPFAFFGQGEASYYEWFEMWVWFERAVPKPERAAVLRKAPRLCKLDAQWPHADLLWPSTGDQWIQQHLVEEYGTAAAKKKMKAATKRQEAEYSGEGGDDDDDDDDDWMDDLIAGGGETTKFNKDIETWLLALHAKQPILFAARRQDFEAGGTKLGKWHEASIAMFSARVLPVLAKLATKKPMKPDDLRRSAISTVLAYMDAGTLAPEVRGLGRTE